MPETIVLIHGLWMTPLSWEHWNGWEGAADHALERSVSQAARLAVPR